MWHPGILVITLVSWLTLIPMVKGVPAADPDPSAIPNFEGLRELLQMEARHFSTLDVCSNAVCDQMLRQANGLARLKTIRKYVVNTMRMMDRLVTALDAELIVAGENLGRSLGNRCRAAHAVLTDVTKGPAESDRLNERSALFTYGRDMLV